MTEPAQDNTVPNTEIPENVVPLNNQGGNQGGGEAKLAEAAEATADIASQIATLQAEAATYKDQALRALAEAENTRRRSIKEREDAGKYGVTALAKELVGVSDNLQRALEHAGTNNENSPADEKMKQLLAGLSGVERQLQSAFERAGIKKLEPLDQPFDPNFHRVMLEAENTGKPAGTVTQVMQAGYVIHDRLLREALVAIAKGEGGDKGAATSAINQQA